MIPALSADPYHDPHHADREFTQVDLSGGRLESKEFVDCTFVHCVFSEVELVACRFVSCTFTSCDLSLASLLDTHFEGTRFEDAKAIGIDWTRAAWPKMTLGEPLSFERCALDHSTFLGLRLPKVRILDCVAREADFREADLTGADFSGTDLTGALFGDTNLSRADLSRARNYAIAPDRNRIGKAKFSLPEALALLHCLDIELTE